MLIHWKRMWKTGSLPWTWFWLAIVSTHDQKDGGRTGPVESKWAPGTRETAVTQARKKDHRICENLGKERQWTSDQWPVTRGSVRVTVGLSNSGHKASEKQQVFRTIGLCPQWTKGPLGTHTWRNTGHTGAGEHCTLRNSRRLRKKEQWVHSIRETNGSQYWRTLGDTRPDEQWTHRTRKTVCT